MGWTEAELSVSLVDDGEIARLAGAYGRRPRATDVLSFAQREGAGRGSAVVLGDVVISLDTARRQAARRGVPLGAELRVLLVHGCLHLLGMDHLRAGDRARMRALERHLAWELARLRQAERSGARSEPRASEGRVARLRRRHRTAGRCPAVGSRK